MALLVTGCCEGQNYKRIHKGVSHILGGLTHLQLLNTMTQMPVKNSLNRSLLTAGLVTPQGVVLCLPCPYTLSLSICF